MTEYQNVFNSTLKNIRMVCNATGNKSLADIVIKLMFDFSDELKQKNLIKGDNDYDREINGNR
jgi:hypothetical protein